MKVNVLEDKKMEMLYLLFPAIGSIRIKVVEQK